DEAVDAVVAETGELRTLARGAIRQIVADGKVIRVRTRGMPSSHRLLSESGFQAETGTPLKAVVLHSRRNEKALHAATAAHSWSEVAAVLRRQAENIGVFTANPVAFQPWTPVRWYERRAGRGPHPVGARQQLVELRERSVEPEDAIGALQSQRAYDNNEPRVPVHRSAGLWPCDDWGAELAAALEPVNFLHPTASGWVWFRTLRVATSTAGAVALAVTRWSEMHRTFDYDLIGNGPRPAPGSQVREADNR
ncbi:MAG: hypothetical protein OXG72_12870, partial [Acidobacteria bacterium]|nr:hypothetical protein [Acidobacteriota bacterium]